MRASVLAFSLAILFINNVVQAAPVTWTFDSGATFSDGASVTGSFIFDAATGVVSNVDIITTAGIYDSNPDDDKALHPGNVYQHFYTVIPDTFGSGDSFSLRIHQALI